MHRPGRIDGVSSAALGAYLLVATVAGCWRAGTIRFALTEPSSCWWRATVAIALAHRRGGRGCRPRAAAVLAVLVIVRLGAQPRYRASSCCRPVQWRARCRSRTGSNSAGISCLARRPSRLLFGGGGLSCPDTTAARGAQKQNKAAGMAAARSDTMGAPGRGVHADRHSRRASTNRIARFRALAGVSRPPHCC